MKLYHQQLKRVNQIHFFEQVLNCTTSRFIDVLVDDRDNWVKYLKERDIGNRLMYPPINKQFAYQVKGEHHVANLAGEKGVWLPSATQLSDEQIKQYLPKD